MSLNRIKNLMILAAVFFAPFYFFRFSIVGIKTNIFEIAVVLVFVLTIYYKATDRTTGTTNKGSIFVYLFLAAAIIAAIWTPDKEKALGIIKGWFVIPFLVYWIIINNFDKKSCAKLSLPFFISLQIVSLWAVLQKIGIIGTLFYQVGDLSFNQYLSGNLRVFGPFESPNYLAMFVVPAFFISLPIFTLIKNNYLKVLIGASYLLPILAVILSKSRGGLVALIVSILTFILIVLVKNRKMSTKVKVATILGLSITKKVVYGLFIADLASKFFNPKSDVLRQEIYKYSIQLIRENPIKGIGLGTFQEKIGDLSAGNDSFRQFALPYALHPHNLYMAMWLSLGLLGIVVFTIIVVAFFKNVLTAKNMILSAVCASAMVAILVHGVVDTTYFKNDLSAIFWILLAFAFLIKNEPIRQNSK